MCQSITEGGARCAAHTRPAYRSALAAADPADPSSWVAVVEAAEAHASTKSGLAEVRADAAGLGGLGGELLTGAAERGEALHTRRGEVASEVEAGVTAARQVRRVNAAATLNTAYPYPQANSLAKVAAVVDAVSGRADTDDGVAAAIGVVPRQGAYYAVAAGYLGLIAETGGSPRSWALTAAGADFLTADANGRVEMLSDLVAAMPAADTVLDGGVEADEEIASNENLSGTTAQRRAAAVSSWMQTLTSPGAAAALTLETDEMSRRLPEASIVAETARANARLRASATREIRRETCPDCFMEKTAAGTCGC